MKLNNSVDLAMTQIDNLGFQLSRFGITDRLNRHTVLAYLFNGQQNLKGELESLTVRLETSKVRANQQCQAIESALETRFGGLLSPAAEALAGIRRQLLYP